MFPKLMKLGNGFQNLDYSLYRPVQHGLFFCSEFEVRTHVSKIATLISTELKAKIWNSPLQLTVAGLVLYYVAMVMGSGYACGPGNSDIAQGVFVCSYNSMPGVYQFAIVIGIALASLCLGRAVSLLEKRRFDAQ